MKIFNAVKNPRKVIRYIKNKLIFTPKMQKSQRSFLENILSDNINDFNQITDEVMNDSEFQNNIIRQFQSVNLPHYPLSRESWPVSNYYLIRKLKPKILIETGVWHGLSTCYILKALKENLDGQLISFDMPANPEEGGYKDLNPLDDDDIITLPLGKDPGWIVPDDLHKHWKLVLGKTEDTLPPVIKDLKKIDFFLHDSEHSYSNMLFEFKIAYQYLSEGGIILGDNINWNDSFYDFCRDENVIPHTYLAYLEDPDLNHPFGGTRKI